MQVSVEFPSVVLREGPERVIELARAVEDLGYDDLAVFDHVVMGFPTDTRPAPLYPPTMPILEPLVLLGFAAAVTRRITLSTEVLILPQRQPILVAKQAGTIDALSGGRLRLGVGVGWQEAEYEALGEPYAGRGRRMDQAIELLRTCWSEPRIDLTGDRFRADAIAMEPKPPQGGALPIWVGGHSAAALRRVGRLGDGWMASMVGAEDEMRRMLGEIRRHAEEAGREPSTIGLQAMVAPPPRDADGKSFYADHDRVARRAEEVRALGFEWISVNATAIFQAGARSAEAIIDQLGQLHGRLRQVAG